MSKPTTVEPGQMWRDRDQRTKGAGEFTVVALQDERGTLTPGQDVSDTILVRVRRMKACWPAAETAIVYRREADRLTRIRTSRLLSGPYEYLGRAR